MTLPEPSRASCGVRRHELMRYSLGELDADRTRFLQQHTETCAECRPRLGEIAADRQAFLAARDPSIESAQILARLEALESQAGARWLDWLAHRRAWLGSAVAAAVLLLALLPRLGGDDPRDPNRTKGSARVGLSMFVNRPGGPEPAASGIALGAGDQIQFSYQAGGYGHIFVVSVDGRRAITPLYPPRPGRSLSVQPAGEHVLDGSVILDDAVGPERVFAFFSEAPLEFEALRAAISTALERSGGDLERLDHVDLPEGGRVSQVSLWFLKR